jgi:hypothetical protein
MGRKRRDRPDMLERVREVLKLFAGLAGEIIRLISLIRTMH